jgi:hypothetical protein
MLLRSRLARRRRDCGAVVFSHWLLDLLVHRPDLELYPQGPKLGFGHCGITEVPEQAVEIGPAWRSPGSMFWSAQRTRARTESLARRRLHRPCSSRCRSSRC